jgi:uncharacterized protein HemY
VTDTTSSRSWKSFLAITWYVVVVFVVIVEWSGSLCHSLPTKKKDFKRRRRRTRGTNPPKKEERSKI